MFVCYSDVVYHAHSFSLPPINDTYMYMYNKIHFIFHSTEGSDFVGLHTEVYLNAATTTICIPITIIEDTALEETESFIFTLNTLEPRVRIVSDSVMISILDNDCE